MTGACIFCRIRDGEVPAHVVHEDETTISFLDHAPMAEGHTLVVLKEHLETLPDAPAESLGPLFAVVRRVSEAVEKTLGADGSLVAVNNRVSQSVPHLHVHVVPRMHRDWTFLLRLFLRRAHRSPDHAADVARRLRESLRAP